MRVIIAILFLSTFIFSDIGIVLNPPVDVSSVYGASSVCTDTNVVDDTTSCPGKKNIYIKKDAFEIGVDVIAQSFIEKYSQYAIQNVIVIGRDKSEELERLGINSRVCPVGDRMCVEESFSANSTVIVVGSKHGSTYDQRTFWLEFIKPFCRKNSIPIITDNRHMFYNLGIATMLIEPDPLVLHDAIEGFIQNIQLGYNPEVLPVTSTNTYINKREAASSGLW